MAGVKSAQKTKNISGTANPIFQPVQPAFGSGSLQYDPLAGQAAAYTAPEEPVDSGGYTSGGGSGAYDPASDPVYQAYISQLDLSLAQQQGDTERRRAALLGQQDQNLYDSGIAGDRSRENISGGYESRGLFNSGGRLQDISRQQADQGTRESRIRQGTATGISDLEYQMAQALAQNQLKRQNASLGVFQ